MDLAYVSISFKQYFNFMCKTDFERRIYHDSYAEFQKKSKIYSHNQSLHSFSEMCLINEKAKSLHQKLQYAVTPSIASLERKMPLFRDTNGNSILFDLAELHIYTSDLQNKAAHVVSITYTTPKLILHEIVNDLLILSYDMQNFEGRTFNIKLTEEVVINYDQVMDLVYN